MIRIASILLLVFFSLLGDAAIAQQGSAQDDKILERGDKLLEEAKTAYEEARTKGSVSAFVDAGFRLEEARIKFIVLQEIGTPDKQKIATDRMRAINQLSKLIHDGKVAVSGTPASPAVANPPEVPLDPLKKDPAASPPQPATDVTRRVPVPDVAKQREAEKLIKELFKDQYVKKAPQDRLALAKSLLDQAVKTPEDPVALWVLYREAQDAAIQGGDVKLARMAIEAAARIFDVDSLSMKVAAFSAAGKNAKSPAEFAVLADSLLTLVDELIAADLYDGADKSSTAALQYARRTTDTGLTARATTCSREVAEARAKYQAMKGALVTLAKTPEDPAANNEMGQFLCFVKGNWDLGLRFLVKGSDPTLKPLAEKEAVASLLSADRVALGDGWYDLSEKEKSPLCKRQLQSHAAVIYESALADTTGLVRAKIGKRLESLQSTGASSGPSGVDLTTLTPKKSKVGYFSLGINTNNADNKTFAVIVNGKECKQYIFAHAPSSVVYDIPPGSRTFTAVGTKLDKNVGFVLATWKYVVIVDGKTIYESKPLNEVKGFDLDISVPLPAGAKELELKVDELENNTCDWAVWAYPKLLK
jgi:hypothetical protein